MISELYKQIRNLLTLPALALGIVSAEANELDTLSQRPIWHVGANAIGGYVFGTNSFLKGDDGEGPINATAGGSVRAGFSFSPSSREGMLYEGLYQGIALEARSFFAESRLGTPISLYVYQGAPFIHLSPRLSLGYEWKFGAAFGWNHYNAETAPTNGAVSTATTAYMGLGLHLIYKLSEQWELTGAFDIAHFSNGNTSLPNAGVNTLGASVGIAYLIGAGQPEAAPSPELIAEADRQRWFYDIVLYGAWRKRAIDVGHDPQLVPGSFGVAGLQFSPMRMFNRYFAAGVALDVKYDESSGLLPYWVEGTYDENIKFYRPPFGKQLSVGLSAHAEFIMPIFAINAGLGFDILSPKGEKHFYQSLTLKTFITKRLFLNVGYRLGNFKDPQNLMLGVGIRL